MRQTARVCDASSEQCACKQISPGCENSSAVSVPVLHGTAGSPTLPRCLGWDEQVGSSPGTPTPGPAQRALCTSPCCSCELPSGGVTPLVPQCSCPWGSSHRVAWYGELWLLVWLWGFFFGHSPFLSFQVNDDPGDGKDDFCQAHG